MAISPSRPLVVDQTTFCVDDMTTVNNSCRPLFATRITRVGCILVRFRDGTRPVIPKLSRPNGASAQKRQVYGTAAASPSQENVDSSTPNGRYARGKFQRGSFPSTSTRGTQRGRSGLEPARVHPTGDGDGDRMPTRTLTTRRIGFCSGKSTKGRRGHKQGHKKGRAPEAPSLRR